LKNQKGFTLMELLIVVAIIGILVAIVVPVFAGVQESAKEAVDKENYRAAEACTATSYLNEALSADDHTPVVEGTYYAYDAGHSRLLPPGETPEPYGVGTTAGAIKEDHVDMYILCTVDEFGRPILEWVK